MDVNNEIDASIPQKSKYVSEFNDFLTSMIERMSNLHLNAQTCDGIYKLFIDLVKNTQTFNAGLFEDDPDADSKQIFGIATEYICGKIDEFSSSDRRKKKCEQNPLFVPPRELSLGLKWEMLRESEIATPKLTVCKFQYISIYDQLTALFQRDDFQDAYWNYNSNPRNDHVCVDGVFKDFCCGKVYKTNQLFQSNQSAIQITYQMTTLKSVILSAQRQQYINFLDFILPFIIRHHSFGPNRITFIRFAFAIQMI